MLLLLFSLSVSATDVNGINININISTNGTAHVIETWNSPIAKSGATGIVNKEMYKNTITISDKFKEAAIKIHVVKKFLTEFLKMEDKNAIEVEQYEYYLIYAQIFGIADKVAKQFKNYIQIIFMNMMI